MKAWSFAAALVVSFLWFGSTTIALDVPKAPTETPILDQTNTLSTAEIGQLSQTITDLETKTGNEVAVLIIPSLEGEDIAVYGLKVARSWGVGQKERDSGVLLLIAKNDRQLRIEVGRGLEGALPDARAAQIIRDRITPEFRQNNYYAGVAAGIDGISSAIRGEVDPNLSSNTSGTSDIVSMIETFGYLLIFGVVWLSSILARTKSWWAGGVIGAIAGGVVSFFVGLLFAGVLWIIGLIVLGLLFDYFVSKEYKKAVGSGNTPSWWAGGASLGGGGSSGGFGGGSFGGGGASGSW